ncbi:hypothetical protein JMJ55_03465 [Belnapia sp. T6]|uniref:TauD/TfdA-like domain-containing protein n=1 Tax=Belnapia mucosa TaxID=2804532 RepID=A0ABS1UY22_9PROT|nr:TauD/TfdA family dioxygenase [Belnapia mucosa]MBL6454368.1 hypothetical protein [Belnapia mucosa]
MTLPPRLVPQLGPAAWSGAALAPADWMIPVGAEVVAELAEADPARRPHLQGILQTVAERLEQGHGFCLLRGLALEAPEAALLALGSQLGTPLPQNAAGLLVGELGGNTRFQADPADAVATLCLQQPPEGGSLTLVAAAALHNALLKSDRAALAVLHREFPHGDPAAPTPLPVLGTAEGAFFGRYDPEALIEAALDPAQAEALAALDAAAEAPGQALTLPLHTGDLLFHNPQLVWLRLGAAMPGRRLLRLWLAMPEARPLPEGFRRILRESAAAPASMVGG